MSSLVRARVTGTSGNIADMPNPAVPAPDCWLTHAVTVEPSPIAGFGLFAARAIGAGEVVARLGGRFVTDAELAGIMASASSYVDTVSVYPDANLILPPGTANHSGNHSCDPNTWWLDPFSTVARREIAKGEEVTIDYASLTDDIEFSMECHCGSPECRGIVSGTDWQSPGLQLAYGEHWVPVLRDRIAA